MPVSRPRAFLAAFCLWAGLAALVVFTILLPGPRK